MSDELFGFGSVIKSLYPEDYDEICKFAQSVLQKPSNVQVTFEENEFPHFAGKLYSLGGSGANNTQLRWGKLDLFLQSNSSGKLGGEVCYKVGGGFFLNKHEFRIVEIGQHRLIFLRWDKDGKTTRIFWNGKQVAVVNKLVGFGIVLFGGSVQVQNLDGDILFTIGFRCALLMVFWSKLRICWGENEEILFPSQWPDTGGLSEKTISDFARVPFEKQMLIVATLLWMSWRALNNQNQ
jgi:hypothetical protein